MVEFDGDAVAAKDVAMHIAAMKPVATSSADAGRAGGQGALDRRAKGRRVGQACRHHRQDGGGVNQKYLKEVSLLDQVFVKAADGKQTVAQYLKGANTTVKGFTLYVVGDTWRRSRTTSRPKWRPRLPRRKRPDRRSPLPDGRLLPRGRPFLQPASSQPVPRTILKR